MVSYNITISLLFNFIFNTFSVIDTEYNTAQIPQCMSNRLNAVPVIFVEGSHYEVGYMIGKTFGKIILDFVEAYGPLKKYLEIYDTKEGKTIYQESLDVTETYFPQYLLELKGIANGANVPFYKLFLIHLDDILPSNSDRSQDNGGTGCSTLIVNRPNVHQFIGHNEDALKETINRFYIINAHIKPRPEEGGGKFATREERWEAMTYAASLSGYASGHNHHGFVFAINTIFAKKLLRKKIPRVFLTRALLASKADISEIEQILTNQGVGTADAFHVNVGFLQDNVIDQKFYSIEVTPSETEQKSNVVVRSVQPDSTEFHVNRLQASPNCEELRESGWESSQAREKRYAELTSYKSVESLPDILNILGDTERGDWQIYRDREDDFVQTINTGVFDFINKIWILWTNNPKTNAPVVKLPLIFPDLTPDPIGGTTSP